MNLQSHFELQWRERFPSHDDHNKPTNSTPRDNSAHSTFDHGVPKLHCLQGENYSTVMEQIDGVSEMQREVQSRLSQLRMEMEKQWFLLQYLHDSKMKMKSVAVIVDPNYVVRDSADEDAKESSQAKRCKTNGGVEGVAETVGSNYCYDEFHPPNFSNVLPSHFSVSEQSIALDGPEARDMLSYPSCNSVMTTSQPNNINKSSSSTTNVVESFIATNSSSSTPASDSKCMICMRQLSSRFALQQHMMMHTGEKPFQCHVCGRQFRQRAQLTTHSRTHDDARPYGCRVCGKRFRQQSHVIQHIKSHTGEKSFKCDVCGKGFRQKKAMEKHMERQCQSRKSCAKIPQGRTLWYGPTSLIGDPAIDMCNISVVGGVSGAAIRFNEPINSGVPPPVATEATTDGERNQSINHCGNGRRTEDSGCLKAEYS